MDKIIQVKEANKLPGHLNHLLNPLISGEKVIVIEDVDDVYVKVKYNKGKTISTFSKVYFECVTKIKIK